MANTAGHLSDDELVEYEYNDDERRSGQRVREHLEHCEACRRQHEELIRLRTLLARTGHRERRPVRDAVPSAMMRLRLRRHSVTNANELLEGIAALMRGLASLFSPPRTNQRFADRSRRAQDETHE